MKILYAVQGTGNGHITRAQVIIPELRKHAEVDVLLSGFSHDLNLPFKVKYRLNGMSFCFGKKGGIDYLSTIKKNKLNRFVKEVRNLDLSDYDFVISDFEPVSSWASLSQNKLCIGLSNQASIFTENVPLPKSADVLGRLILKRYAPCKVSVGMHFQRYNENIFTPVIDDAIRRAEVTDKGFYLIYLPAYELKKIKKVFREISSETFMVFSKEVKNIKQRNNITYAPLNRNHFIAALASAKGVITAAGFSTVSEALFLKKKLLVIPQKGQFEQKCNAAALKQMGVIILKKLKRKRIPGIVEWMQREERIKISYPDNVKEIVQHVLKLASIYNSQGLEHTSRFDLRMLNSSSIFNR